jgi:ribosomal 50S subunit-associated protein YjgA (DUF615 family)
MGKKKEVMTMTVKRRKLEYLGHLMRNDTKCKSLKSILKTRNKKDGSRT